MTLQYENATHVWCTLSLSAGRHDHRHIQGPDRGLRSATSNFSLAAGHSLTIPFRIKFASDANVGTQTALFILETVNTGGTVVAPFTTALSGNGTPINAPYATGKIHNNPTTKYTVTVHASPPATTTRGLRDGAERHASHARQQQQQTQSITRARRAR